MQITSEALHVLHHTLGLSPDRREPFRNHFVAGVGHRDMPTLEELERAGMMERRRTPAFCDKADVVFAATDAGRSLAIDLLPPKPVRTKYDEFLREDCFDSFSDFLGIWKPTYESRFIGKKWEFRMYRMKTYERDVEGAWAPTKKSAKASYKAALKARNQPQKGRD